MHARTRHSIIAAALALTAACVPPAGAPATDAAAVRLQDTAWTLVELGGAPVTPDADGRRPSLRLDGATARFTGFGGCNRLSGAYELDGGTLRFPTIGATRMYCDAAPGEALGEGFEMSHVAPQSAVDGGHQVLHLGVAFQPDEFRHLDGAIFADAPEVVAEQVGDHDQFGHFLRAGL
jgi:putative lipoprotein